MSREGASGGSEESVCSFLAPAASITMQYNDILTRLCDLRLSPHHMFFPFPCAFGEIQRLIPFEVIYLPQKFVYN